MTVRHEGLESASYAAEQEARGMPDRFMSARDSGEAYSNPMYRDSTNALVAIAHLHNAMRLGVRSEVLKELIAAIKELEKS